jgi:ribosomal-protein-alanine N-acetyltransferase
MLAKRRRSIAPPAPVKPHRIDRGKSVLVVREIETDDEAEACARIMASSEPWLTLGRDYAASLGAVRDPSREVYVAIAVGDAEVVGFLILSMRGAFAGYIQSVGVRHDWRGRGLGTALIAFAESRIFAETPNAFICASSFNERARALYERLGYETVGELRDYIVRGHSEWLLRKSIAPLADWTTSREAR